MADLTLPETAARHLAYHSRMAAEFAAAGNLDECASEALLAWAILSRHDDGHITDAPTVDLPEPSSVSESPASGDAVRRRAHTLALSLEGHFTSEGQTDSADLYEQLAAELDQH